MNNFWRRPVLAPGNNLKGGTCTLDHAVYEGTDVPIIGDRLTLIKTPNERAEVTKFDSSNPPKMRFNRGSLSVDVSILTVKNLLIAYQDPYNFWLISIPYYSYCDTAIETFVIATLKGADNNISLEDLVTGVNAVEAIAPIWDEYSIGDCCDRDNAPEGCRKISFDDVLKYCFPIVFFGQ